MFFCIFKSVQNFELGINNQEILVSISINVKVADSKAYGEVNVTDMNTKCDNLQNLSFFSVLYDHVFCLILDIMLYFCTSIHLNSLYLVWNKVCIVYTVVLYMCM